MSSRQPILNIDGIVIALDEIVRIINHGLTGTLAGRRKSGAMKSVQLVDGTLVPLSSPKKVREVLEFIDRYDR